MAYFKKNSLFLSYLFLANPYYFLFHEISEIRNLPFPPVNRCMSSQLSQKGHLTWVHRKKSGYGYINYHYCKVCTHEIRWNKKSYFIFGFLFIWNYKNSCYFLFHEIEIVHPYQKLGRSQFYMCEVPQNWSLPEHVEFYVISVSPLKSLLNSLS